MRYPNGGVAQAENSWAAHGGLDLRFEIHGSEGSIFGDPTRETSLKCFSLGGSGYVVEKAEMQKGWLFPIIDECRAYGYLDELRAFFVSFSRDEMPRETFEDGLIVNQIIDAAYTLFYKSHVSIDIIYGRYSPRTRGILDIITYLVFFFPFCLIVFYQGIIFAQTSWSIGETSESAALRIVPLVKTVIPVTFGLLLLQGLANFIRSIMLVLKGKEI